MRCWGTIAVLVMGVGCHPIRTSAVATGEASAPYEGAVVVVTTAPVDSAELGLVNASGPDANVEDLTREFAHRVAKLGGNVAVVDRIRTHYETKTYSQSYSYNCGDSKTPRTCYGTRWVTEEVGTTSMLGRAFRTGK